MINSQDKQMLYTDFYNSPHFCYRSINYNKPHPNVGKV